MLLNLFLLLIGFVVLIKGADIMVNGASSIARKLKVSSLIIGLTIVASGTSAPELVVNVLNSYNDRNDAIFGNVIGSNIFNLLFIMGVAGLIHPLVVHKNSIKYEVPISLFAVLLLGFLVNDALFFHSEINILSRGNAALLLVGFLAFSYYIYRTMNDQIENNAEEDIKEYTVVLSIVFVVIGISMLVLGGYLVTENAVSIAQQLNLSEKLIGLTILAVGTSLPELATSAVAAYRKNTDIAVGNIVGSNIFNIFFVMGISGLIQPVRFQPALNLDILVLISATVVVLLSMFTFKRNKVDRREAFVFVLLYLGYTYYLIIRN